MAVAQAIDHCRQRKAFGRVLTESAADAKHPCGPRPRGRPGPGPGAGAGVARCPGARRERRHDRGGLRAAVPLGKFLCKRAPGHAYEAMECIGGSGFIEDGPMPRLYREAPVNAILEGSGNIQYLDLLRAFARQPETREALLNEIDKARGGEAVFDSHAAALRTELGNSAEFASEMEG
nr:acyl-CoA dehydrogenase family protein [Rhodoblastus acidophilus]